ncbi:hypothetical protein E4U60_004446 [Claviceps pazoutovae]|uniref:Yippee domain-containing protein n=1 Tax=Claviceps pazoutovae TaxID=1649127 RepID=A0A9P7M977_9HYPO|nr:hypothetical protein E4U60_004446 [Claviceps pazoutovae]
MARRRSSTSIVATPPIFPAYLLSSFNFVLHHRKSTAPLSSTASAAASSSSSSPTSSPASSPASFPASSPATIPSGSHRHSTPVDKHPLSRRVSRAAPDTLRCRSCSTDLAFTAQIISKGFTGRYGHACLVAPEPAQSPATEDAQPSLLNIRIGRSEDRQLVTGWHTVADICCATCACNLGWKYVDAQEASQTYKVGKYILEMERVVKHRNWDDVAVRDLGIFEREKGEEEKEVEARGHDEGDDGDSDEIVFDSSDEEECEDIFSGTWNATAVAKRRSQAVARSISLVL